METLLCSRSHSHQSRTPSAMVYRLSLASDANAATTATLTRACGIPLPAIDGANDVIDETLDMFRANVLFRKFDVAHEADKLLAMLTATCASALRRLANARDRNEGERIAKEFASETFAIPGDGDFEFPGLFPVAETRREADAYRAFMKRAREAIATRLVDRCFDKDTGAPNKFWMAFAKRKFMNIKT